MLSKPHLAALVVFLAIAVLCPPAPACNTPVYRYAMYNWQTSPYIVFYFYEGQIPEADQAVHKSLAKLAEEFPLQANVRLEPIAVSDTAKMETLPQFVIDAWKAHENGKTPAYVIFSPTRAHIYSGSLDAQSVEKLVHSPARQTLGELLAEGNAAVMILLTCPNEAENKRAEEALAGLCKTAEAGEIPVELQLPPMGLPGQSEGDEQASAADSADARKLGIAVLKVNRNDPAEEFFVRMLMAIEDDLKDYADQPMIFAGYGRGRALEPYIGKGITSENLVNVVAFLAGACSCLVKEQNPGADLLVKWDWEKTADKMAENDPSLNYDSSGSPSYAEFPVEPAAAAGASSADAASGDVRTPQPAASEVVLAASAEKDPSSAMAAAPSPSEASIEANGEPLSGAPAVAQAIPASSSDNSPLQSTAAPAGSFFGRRMATYAIGFGAIAVGVVLAGLALVMRRS